MSACPIDQAAMRTIPLQGGMVEHECGRCGGLWLPGALVRATIGEVPPQRLKAAADSARRIHCPADGGRLVAILHHGVEIDVCPCCSGVWLDAGERTRILDSGKPAAARGNALDDLSGAVDLIDIGGDLVDLAGDTAGKLLEFVGDAFSGL